MNIETRMTDWKAVTQAGATWGSTGGGTSGGDQGMTTAPTPG